MKKHHFVVDIEVYIFDVSKSICNIAFVSFLDSNLEIYVMDSDGSDPVNLTNDPYDDRFPAWSPDGNRLAFASSRVGNFELYVMDADGSNLVRLTQERGYDRVPAWSPDGTKIAFFTDRDGSYSDSSKNYEIYVMDADGSNQVRLTNNSAWDGQPTWSR